MPTKTLCSTTLGLAGLFAALAIFGCSNGTSPSTTTSPTPPAVVVTVTGPAQVRLGSTVQLYSSVANTANPSVTWQVNGVTGGSSTTGTISSSGLYTPPSAIPASNPLTIAAVSVASPTISGTLSEMVENPVPAITSATANTTGNTSYLVDVVGSSFVSGATIQVGSASLTTTFISATELQGAYTAASGQAATSASLSPIRIPAPAPPAA